MSEYTQYKDYLSNYLKNNKKHPRSIFIEVTPLCNLRCVFCPCYIKGEEVTKDRKTKYMSLENFQKIIDHIDGKFNFQICFTYSGEPLINKNIFKMVGYLNDKDIPSVIHSNAMLLAPKKISEMLDSGLDRFVVSFDGATKETYEDIRRGSKFDKVVDNIRNLIQERNSLGLSKPFVEMQFVVTSKNKHEIPLFKALCDELGVDNGYTKTLLVFQDTANKDYVKEVKEYFIEDDVARYKLGENNELILKDLGPCPEIQNCVITVDGDVVICCFDVHGKYKHGNAIEKSLTDIWDSEEYRDFRKNIMNKRALPICKYCNTSTHITRET
jgi:radical SAM protein with 4Fe4S-binding SPASM domain